jgi:hypothetical protein
MKNTFLIAVAIGTVLALTTGALAVGVGADLVSRVPEPGMPLGGAQFERVDLETLWIFDADFENLTGDNAGWTAYDRSGTLAMENYWHHDTIRISGHPSMGESTWWCGRSSPCWRQPRGYGNDWLQILERHFTEASGHEGVLTLEFDQRYAMEMLYDYGYVDIRSSATSDAWVTIETMTNFGFLRGPGLPIDWDETPPDHPGGHVTLDITTQGMGVEFDLRFRFESDVAYSSQDQWNNDMNSVKDGAWQLDNITILDDDVPIFYDDCESYGQNGWVHDDMEAAGQVGVFFERKQFGINCITGREFTCDDRPYGSWMYAATSLVTMAMVDTMFTWLVSPPIDVSAAPKLVGHWDMWVDLPEETNDVFNLSLAADSLYECVTSTDGFVDESPGWWYGGPFWGNWIDDWDAFSGKTWLAIRWELENRSKSEEVPPLPRHRAGIFLNRQRVGIPSGDAGTAWDYSVWYRFNDWYVEQMEKALVDTVFITVKDDDNISTVTLIAENALTQNSYTCIRVDPNGNLWDVPAPETEMIGGAEIHYYYEALDTVGNTSTYPRSAPDSYFEFSILPINSFNNDGILLVDKHGRRTPGAERNYRHSSEYYYREMLEILGYEWETYDVEVPSGSNWQSDGPDTVAYKYYDTQIWFTNEFSSYTIKDPDQLNLIAWLNTASAGNECNLLITGNDWGREVASTLEDPHAFYATWMASHYEADAIGSVMVDSVPGILETGGGWTFMDHADGAAILRGACPQLHYYDVVSHDNNIEGAEMVLEYKDMDGFAHGAGCAYTHATMGYQTVNLGFGMEYMADGTVGGGSGNYTAEGYYHVGVEDRVNLMGNIMAYFEQTPTGDPTGVEGGIKNQLSHAYPNPFNPVTKIAYSVKEAGPVTISVYNVAGKVVRTLLDEEFKAGAEGFVVWNGANDGGERCASGVYFYRIAAPGFMESRKMIMLK